MQIPLVRFLTLCTPILSQTLTTTTTPSPGHDASALISLIAELNKTTLGIPQPPDEFEMTYEIGGPKLRVTSCLMNVVAALKELAVVDWDAKIIDGTEYTLDTFPEVSVIITTTKRKRNIQARFLLWALCLGMYEMIAQRKFEFAQFEMSWERKVLGWVQIVNHPPRPGPSSLKQTQANGTLNSRANPATLLNATAVITPDTANDAAAEARLNVTFSPYGESLSIYDVFVPIMSGITDMATFPSTYESTALMIGLQGFKGFICVLPAVPHRTSPPFLEYGWLIRAVARIPTYMLGEGRFGEVNMKIMVDDVAVGYGRLCNAPDCDGEMCDGEVVGES